VLVAPLLCLSLTATGPSPGPVAPIVAPIVAPVVAPIVARGVAGGVARGVTRGVTRSATCFESRTDGHDVAPIGARGGGPRTARVRPTARAGRDADVDELAERLEDRDDEVRARAVSALARQGSAEAWELVLGALADSASRVADEAQLRLGGCRDADVLEELCGAAGLRSREPGVPARAAEVLGRIPLPLDAERIVRSLGDRDAEVRRALAWSVERAAARGSLTGRVSDELVPALAARVRRDRDAGVAAAALVALARVDPEQARAPVAAALGDRREELRMAGVELALGFAQSADDGRDDDERAEGARRGRRAVELPASGDAWIRSLPPTAAEPSARVRMRIAELLEQLGSRAAVVELVERLASEPRLRVQWRIVDGLRRLSGRRYRLDPRPWRLWASRLPASWRPARGESVRDETGGSRAFAGMPLRSDRLAFLVDFSGSVWRRQEGGGTRKTYADRELRRALASLSEQARFNVVPYTDEPLPWRPSLAAAEPRDVAEALAYFEDCDASGKGDFFGAALLALGDPELDTVVVMTDGAPTGGRSWKLELMMPLLLERNRFRRVRFDVVLVDAARGLQRRWREFAEETGGRCVVVQMAAEEGG